MISTQAEREEAERLAVNAGHSITPLLAGASDNIYL